MRRFDLIVFDWDGTLMDSVEKIVRCFTAAAEDVGVTAPRPEEIQNIIGLGLREAFDELFPDQDDVPMAKLVDRYREHFLHLDDTSMELFPGVEYGLPTLVDRGYRLAVATGKARRGLDRVLRQTQTGPYFTTTRCADESRSKPHPQMLIDILAHTGVQAADTLMVGDSVYDMEMAKGAGVASLAVSYGVHDAKRLASHDPLDCLDTFEAVHEWLLQSA